MKVLMRFLSLAAAVAVAVLFAQSADAGTILIGEGVQNGSFSDTSNPTSATGDAITTNAGGRALISSSSTNDSIEIDGWAALRKSYSGGNAAFGWDAAGGAGPSGGRTGGDVPYAFVNSGGVEFIADTVNGSFPAGDVFDLSFNSFQVNSSAGTITAMLTFDNGEVASFPVHTTAGVDTVGTFSDSYTLINAATTVSVSLLMESSSSQFAMDDVVLEHAVPEPGTIALSMLAFAGFGAVGMRSRLG